MCLRSCIQRKSFYTHCENNEHDGHDAAKSKHKQHAQNKTKNHSLHMPEKLYYAANFRLLFSFTSIVTLGWIQNVTLLPLSVRQPRVQLFFLHILATDLISRFKTLIYFQVKTRFTFSMCAFFSPKVFWRSLQRQTFNFPFATGLIEM